MIGKTIIELDRVDSTNEYAAGLLQDEHPEEGLVIWAHEQVAGKGQNESRWESEPGKNLTFSVILHPVFLAPDRQFMLNKSVSLGVLDFVTALIPGATIKWPNDIYIGTRKVAGILIRNMVAGTIIESSVVGIGININQVRFAHEIPNPVSLTQILQREMTLKEALATVCGFLDCRYLQLKNGDHGKINQDYQQCLMGSGEWRMFKKNEEEFEGRIEGVDHFGRLLIVTREGNRLSFDHKEIEYLF